MRAIFYNSGKSWLVLDGNCGTLVGGDIRVCVRKNVWSICKGAVVNMTQLISSKYGNYLKIRIYVWLSAS